MGYLPRELHDPVAQALKRGRSVLLLGARQTGKSTLAAQFPCQLALNFVRPEVRQRYAARPELLGRELEALPRGEHAPPLVFFDEIQRLPLCLDVAQDAIDRKIARFILTGSSARQLRRGQQINLLPGRVVALRLEPLSHAECPPATELATLLEDGSLPGIVSQPSPAHREQDLASYVSVYLEEEVRAEALTRDIGRFARFLELAALSAGQVLNFSKIGDDLGVSHSTIRAYYEVLEDCLMLCRVPPLIRSATRQRLTRSSKTLLFDMGVRRLCAREARGLPAQRAGELLEQFVGLELVRAAGRRGLRQVVHFWRDPSGPEVDWILQLPGRLVPIEVKWTDAPRERDIRHLRTFMAEYPEAPRGFVVCRTPRPLQLTEHIVALPWQDLQAVWN